MTEAEKQEQPQDSLNNPVSEEDEGRARPQVHSPNAQNAEGKKNGGRRKNGALAWLALLVALVAVGLASYPYWSHWVQPEQTDSPEPVGPSISAFERLSSRVDQVQQSSTDVSEELRVELSRLSDVVASQDADARVDDLVRRMDQLANRIERLQVERNTDLGGVRGDLQEFEAEVGRRLETFETRLAAIGGNLDRADNDLATRLLIMEVDSLFAIAQNQLSISGDGHAAAEIWQRGVDRLAALDDAEFQSLKEMARREFRQLQAYRPPDVALQVERLFEIAEDVEKWTVKSGQSADQTVAPGADQGWRGRLGKVFGSLVRVESVEREFLGPDEISQARERVRTTLQTAALAIVRARPELSEQLIDEARDVVQRVFDTGSENVSEALSWLQSMGYVERAQAPELNETRAEISRLLGDER